MLHLDRAGVLGEHVGEAAIGLRRLVEVAADEVHALVAQPRLHLVVAHAAGLADALAGRRILARAAARLGARHHPAGAVHRRVEARRRRLARDAAQDHGVVAHRAADEAALAREGRRRALAHHPQRAVAVALAPSVVVVVVHGVEHLAADDRTHALDHPLAARVGVLARERQGGEILAAEIAVLVQDGRHDVDAVGAAGELDERGRGLVAEAARAEMHADPDQPVLVGEQIDIVVARADGAELVARHLLEPARDLALLPQRIVEHRVLDLFRIGAADAEADAAGDLRHQFADAIGDRRLPDIELHRHVAARDVEADAAHRDVLLVGDDAADRLGIAEMAVGAQHAADRAAVLHAARHLRLGAVVVVAKDLDLGHRGLLR